RNSWRSASCSSVGPRTRREDVMVADDPSTVPDADISWAKGSSGRTTSAPASMSAAISVTRWRRPSSMAWPNWRLRMTYSEPADESSRTAEPMANRRARRPRRLRGPQARLCPSVRPRMRPTVRPMRGLRTSGPVVAALFSQAVPRPPDRLDAVPAEGTVDLLAEVANVDVDHVRGPVVGEVPDVLEDASPGEHLARVAHELLEEGELLGGEEDLLPVPGDQALHRVEGEVAHLEDHRALARVPAGDGPEAGEELGEGEGLGEVVVGAGVEAGHPIVDGIPGRQHHHGRPPALLAQAPAHLEPVGTGDHGVEHDGVVLVLASRPEGGIAVAGHVDRVPLTLEAPLDQRGHLGFVLHHEHTHDGDGTGLS